MATIIEQEAVVRADGAVEVETPGLMPGQRVKVIVQTSEPAPQSLDWETASPGEIIEQLRAARVESERDIDRGYEGLCPRHRHLHFSPQAPTACGD